MKINKRSNGKRKLLIILSIVLVLLVSSIAAAVFAKLGPFEPQPNTTTSADLDKPTNEQIKAGESIKKNSIDNNSKGTSNGSDPLPSPTPPSTPGGKSTVGMDISAANQDSGVLYVRSLIQVITSSGSCQLKMSGPGGKTYSASSAVQAVSSSSTCEGFNVPVSSLSPGNWAIDLSFSDGSYTASTSKEVLIK